MEATVLFRVKNEHRIKEMQSGILQFGSLGFYREYELATGNDKIGDAFEAIAHVQNGRLELRESDKTIELRDAHFLTKASNRFALCMICPKTGSKAFRFSEDDKIKLREFGGHGLLILDCNEFAKRIRVACNREKAKYCADGFVSYYDEAEDHLDYWISHLVNGADYTDGFWKRKRYEYQQEYRFIIEPPTPTNSTHYSLNIGNITDISIVFTVEQILDMSLFLSS